ncbi:MAG: hypothetical protein ACM34A_12175 [Bacillota bacterium]
MRDAALRVLYESVKARVGVDFEHFSKSLDGWNITPLEQDGELIGAFIERDGEIHVGYGSKPKGSIVKHINETLRRLVDEMGAVTTKVSEQNIAGLRFCKRLGFIETMRDSGIVFMRCERCNYA